MAKFKRIGMGLSSNDVICTRKSVFYIQVQLELQKPQMTIQFHIDIACNQKLCKKFLVTITVFVVTQKLLPDLNVKYRRYHNDNHSNFHTNNNCTRVENSFYWLDCILFITYKIHFMSSHDK